SVAGAAGGPPGAPAEGPDVRLPLGMLTAEAGRSPGDVITIVVGAPLGRLTWSQMALVEGLLRVGEVIRLGIAGRLVIPLAGSPDAAAALARLADAGLLVTADDPLARVTACARAARRPSPHP